VFVAADHNAGDDSRTPYMQIVIAAGDHEGSEVLGEPSCRAGPAAPHDDVARRGFCQLSCNLLGEPTRCQHFARTGRDRVAMPIAMSPDPKCMAASQSQSFVRCPKLVLTDPADEQGLVHFLLNPAARADRIEVVIPLVELEPLIRTVEPHYFLR